MLILFAAVLVVLVMFNRVTPVAAVVVFLLGCLLLAMFDRATLGF